jgi:hypothetical protein
MSDFRFRRLERYKIGGTRDEMKLSIPLPKTPSGKSYRLCPGADCTPRLFLFGNAPLDRHVSEEYQHIVRRLPNTAGTTCPYCGFDGPDDEFIHPEDIKAVQELVKWSAGQDVHDFMEGLASDFNRSMGKAGGNLFSVKMDIKSSTLSRPHVWREDLLRNLACDICGREYSVYAIGLFCPDCGSCNVHVHFRREIELVNQQIALADEVGAEGDQELAYRLLGNAHEDVLTAYETYLKSIYRYLAKRDLSAEEAKRISSKQFVGNRFQNIDRGRVLFEKIGIDLYSQVKESDLNFLRMNIEKRHVVGHNLSMVDETYIEVDQTEQPGETVQLLGGEISRFAEICAVIVLRLRENLDLSHGEEESAQE